MGLGDNSVRMSNKISDFLHPSTTGQKLHLKGKPRGE
jgi:hypothetical protein